METQAKFTIAEAAAIVGLPAKRIRKEVERKVIGGRARTEERTLRFAELVYLRALRRMQPVEFSVDVRSQLSKRIASTMERAVNRKRARVPLADLVTLDVGPLIRELRSRIERFARWKKTLVEDPEMMGGATVFPQSRLTVRHVGEMIEKGVSPGAIREDYPYLSEKDLEFASLFVRAYPRVGRPPRGRQTAHR